MANWVVYEKASNLQLIYRNSINGSVHACGLLRRDTPLDMIVDWVVKSGNPAAFDLIKLHDGTVYQVQPQLTA